MESSRLSEVCETFSSFDKSGLNINNMKDQKKVKLEAKLFQPNKASDRRAQEIVSLIT